MSRLVNEKGEPYVDDALEGFTPTDYYRGYKDGYEDAMAQIVRCGECLYSYRCDKEMFCDIWGDRFVHWDYEEPITPDMFCSFGERRK